MATRSSNQGTAASLGSDYNYAQSQRLENRTNEVFNAEDFPKSANAPTMKAYKNIATNIAKFRFEGVPNDAEAMERFLGEWPAVLKSLQMVSPDLKPDEALFAFGNINKELGNTVRNVEGAKNGQVVYVGDNIKYNAGPKGSGLRQGISTKKDAVVVAQATSANGDKWVKVVSNTRFYIEDGREQSSSVLWISDKGQALTSTLEAEKLNLEGDGKKTPTAEFVQSFFEFHKPKVWQIG